MSEYVKMGKYLCVATGKTFESGEILLDKRLKDIPEDKTVTGWGISPEIQEKIDNGFIVCVSIDLDKSGAKEGKHLQPDSVYRTGQIAYIRELAFFGITGREPENKIIFVDDGFIEMMQKIIADIPNEEKSDDE